MEKELLKKIQKLLSLATSDNEHEAKLAMDRANQLLVKHNITMQAATASLEYEKSVLSEDNKISSEDKFIRPLLQEYFFVKIVTSRKRQRLSHGHVVGTTTTFILGTETNVQIAEYVYGYLKNTFKSLFKAYKASTGCATRARQSYYLGLYDGLSGQLQKTKVKVQQEEGLVLVDDTKLATFMDGSFNNLKTKSQKFSNPDDQAMSDGARQGEKIRISRGIESNGKKGLYLT